ncbi:MAG TPA: hypothetical protein VFK88_03065 [Gallionella sp.]|nr:hypothetical protein [Gallionella sp.]
MKMNCLLFATLLLLGACGDRSTPPKIAAPQREALDKAKKLDQTMQKKAEEEQKKIDEAGK